MESKLSSRSKYSSQYFADYVSVRGQGPHPYATEKIRTLCILTQHKIEFNILPRLAYMNKPQEREMWEDPKVDGKML